MTSTSVRGQLLSVELSEGAALLSLGASLPNQRSICYWVVVQDVPYATDLVLGTELSIEAFPLGLKFTEAGDEVRLLHTTGQGQLNE